MDFEGAFFNSEDYELTNTTLGQGIFGKVFTVKNISTNDEYAVKIINTSNGFNGPEQMSFMRESMTLRQLHHPSIAQFYNINFQSFTDQNKLEPSMIIQYFPHGSLKVILDKERNSVEDPKWNPTKKYINLLGIANAMRYLHKHGVVHCDLKPENILIDEDYFPHICDYGLSTCFSELLSKLLHLILSKNIGTPIYIAPELFEEENEKTQMNSGVDVFSFGIIAYAIVTGKEPYAELGKINSFKLLAKIISGYRPQFTNDISEKMKELILKCLNKNINERPSFDQIFADLSSNISDFDSNVNKDEVNEYLKKISKEEAQAEKTGTSERKESNDSCPRAQNVASCKENVNEVERLNKKLDKDSKDYAEIVKVLVSKIDNINDVEIDKVHI